MFNNRKQDGKAAGAYIHVLDLVVVENGLVLMFVFLKQQQQYRSSRSSRYKVCTFHQTPLSAPPSSLEFFFQVWTLLNRCWLLKMLCLCVFVFSFLAIFITGGNLRFFAFWLVPRCTRITILFASGCFSRFNLSDTSVQLTVLCVRG